MGGTDFSGKFLTSYSLYNERQQDKAEVTSLEEKVKHLTSRGGSVSSKSRKGCQSLRFNPYPSKTWKRDSSGRLNSSDSTAIEKRVCLAPSFPILSWRDRFEKSSSTETKHLYLKHISFIEEEVGLIRLLIKEYESKEVKWILFQELTSNFDIEDLKALICLHHINNGFYGRLWVIRDKQTKMPIGIFETGSPDKNGICPIVRHLLKEHCGKGLGTEAIEGLFELYKQTTGATYESYSANQKQHYLKQYLLKLAKLNMDDKKFDDFSSRLKLASNNDLYEKRFELSSLFPSEKFAIVYLFLLKFSKSNEHKEDLFRGFSSAPVSESSRKSIAKCGFVAVKEKACTFIKI